MKKTIFMLMLVCAIVFVIAFPVNAAEEGTCGENLTWEFDPDTGTLTISGQGEMKAGDYPPWNAYKKSIVKIIIKDGVSSISYGAFMQLSNLETVRLPGSLRKIEGNAFNGCSKLQDISLENVTQIETQAFAKTGLRSLTIPSGVTTIAYGAFSECTKLASVTFHSGVTAIGSYAFQGCSSLSAINIPNSVTSLGSSAFRSCYQLSEVTLGSGITELSNQAFGSCPNLTEIRIPDSVKTIGNYAFTDCTGLRDVFIGAGVSNIASTAFWGCTNLGAFSVSGGNSSYYSDRGVIYNKSKTSLVLFPQGFSGDYSVLSGTKKISEYAGKDCAKLTGITIPGTVAEIERYAFSGCAGLNRVKLSYGVSRINTYAFAGCKALEKLEFPASISFLGDLVFSRTPKTLEITFTGSAPQFSKDTFGDSSPTVYYPGDDPMWHNATSLYGGSPKWISISCNGNHTPVTDSAKDATCTEDGLTQGSHCSVCGEVIVPQETIAAAGHSFGEWEVVVASTTEADGLAERACSVCMETEQKVLEKIASGGEATETTKPEQTEQRDPTSPTQKQEIIEDTPSGDSTVPELPLDGTDGAIPIEPVSTGDSTEPTVFQGETSVTEQIPSEPQEKSAAADTGVDTTTIIVAAASTVALSAGTVAVLLILKRKRLL